MTSRGLCLLALTASFLGSAACSSDSATPEKSGSVEVFSWWTAGGESNALQAVIDLNKTAYPKVTVQNAAVALGDQARKVLKDRMTAADPPDLFQANMGADLLQWAGAQPKIEDLTSIAPTDYYPDVVAQVSQSGVLYGTPVNIHRINSLFVNLHVLERNSVDVASLTTLENLYTALDTLATDTTISAPINIGSQGAWTLDILMLQNVLPAVAGGEFYENYFRGQVDTVTATPNLTSMLTETGKLWAYMPKTTNPPNTTDWLIAIDDFIAGKVGMTVMGNWAKGILDAGGTVGDAAKMTAGVDYDEIAFPALAGVASSFVYTADTFALPIGAPSHDLAVDFLKTFASDEGQLQFNILKGSIPARPLAADFIARFDPTTQGTITAFEDAATDHRIALSGIVTSAYTDIIDPAIKNFTLSCEAGACDSATMLTVFSDNLGQLQ